MQDVMKEIGIRAHLRSLTQELAALTGASEIDAVMGALEDRVTRVKGPAAREERIGEALASLRSSLRFNRDASRQEQDAAVDSGGAVTLDASALLTIHRRGEGWEELVRQAMKSGNARVASTALAEAGMALAPEGNFVDVLGLCEIVDMLNLTVVPFTDADWRTAVIEYHNRRDPNTQEAPSFGDCLTAAVAGRTGTSVLRPASSALPLPGAAARLA